jgi:CubicO group peptidase (beta-lactamase class C family)
MQRKAVSARQLSGLLLLVACGRSGHPPPVAPRQVSDATQVTTSVDPAAPASVLIAADAARETPTGVTFTAPAGWTLTQQGALIILTAQEGDSRLAIMDATAALPDAAVAEIWSHYRFRTPPPIKLASELPARDGWEQRLQFDYEQSPNEKRSVVAGALRHGRTWTVLLVDTDHATYGKRAAQFALVADSLRPARYAPESFAGKTAQRLDAARLAKLDELIEVARELLGIPGASLALVQDGKLIVAKGYGVRELGKPAPVDAGTLFPIASNTKALSTLLLARLVDEGKLRWDEPVREAYPPFRLGDLLTTRETRVEHLVCACTGLPRKDLGVLFEFAGATAQSAMAALAALQPTTKFGETFQYSNALAAAAGFVAGHVVSPGAELGSAYDAAMESRVFRPLGMKSTTFVFQRALARNHASAHGWDAEGRAALAPIGANYFVVSMRPAGGAWSSARDLIRYVQLELADGVGPDGSRVVSALNLRKRRQPYAKFGERGAYGMGLFVDQTYDVTTISHGGSLIGFKSDMFWLPEHGVGAVLLTNADAGAILTGVFRRLLLEQLFDGRPEALEDLRSLATRSRAEVAAARARLELPAPSAAAALLARRYRHPELGDIEVRSEPPDTTFDFGEWRSTVALRRNDDGTVSFVTTTPGVSGFTFVVNGGEKRTLVLREAQHEYAFEEAE